jgi:hypothetical protein
MQTKSGLVDRSAVPQKILPSDHTAIAADCGDQTHDADNDGPIMRSLVQNPSGSGVHENGMASDVLHLNPLFNNLSSDSGLLAPPFFSINNDVAASLEPDNIHMDDAMGSSCVQKTEKSAFGFNNTTRDDSFLKNTGELPMFFEGSSSDTLHTQTISFVENDSVSHCPSIEEVIAFGGIPKPNSGVRSSIRLGGQPNADMPQMEKAMKMAQVRDDSFASGQLTTPLHSIINIPDSEIAR